MQIERIKSFGFRSSRARCSAALSWSTVFERSNSSGDRRAGDTGDVALAADTSSETIRLSWALGELLRWMVKLLLFTSNWPLLVLLIVGWSTDFVRFSWLSERDCFCWSIGTASRPDARLLSMSSEPPSPGRADRRRRRSLVYWNESCFSILLCRFAGWFEWRSEWMSVWRSEWRSGWRSGYRSTDCLSDCLSCCCFSDLSKYRSNSWSSGRAFRLALRWPNGSSSSSSSNSKLSFDRPVRKALSTLSFEPSMVSSRPDGCLPPPAFVRLVAIMVRLRLSMALQLLHIRLLHTSQRMAGSFARHFRQQAQYSVTATDCSILFVYQLDSRLAI